MNKWIRTTVVLGLCGSVAGSAAWAQTQDQETWPQEQAAKVQEQKARQQEQAAKDRAAKLKTLAEEAAYLSATAALDAGRYAKAMEQLAKVVEIRGVRYDGALYWKAYAENKLGLKPEALSTVRQLLKERASSRWALDAKALEVEIRGAGGLQFKFETQARDDLKLLAINDLLHSHTDEAVGMLEKMLQSSDGQKTKSLALFVLCQSGSPKARQVLIETAKGNPDPDLQRQAITYLGMFGSGSKETHQALADVYMITKDTDVKRQILQTYVMSGQRDRLIAAARGEADTLLRLEAVRGLTIVGEPNESATLIDVYGAAGQTAQIRNEIINALFIRGDAKALGDLARKESDPRIKLVIEQRLEQMRKKD